ncbi:MAG: hypothetical protein V4621_03765 [Pseudomonadota bacterium]
MTDDSPKIGKFTVLAPPMVLSPQNADFFGDVLDGGTLDLTQLQAAVAFYGWNENDPRSALTPIVPTHAVAGHDNLFAYNAAQGLYAMAWTYMDPSRPDAAFDWSQTLALIFKKQTVDEKDMYLPYQLCIGTDTDFVIPFRFGCCGSKGCSMVFVVTDHETQGRGLIQVDSALTEPHARDYFLEQLPGGIATSPADVRHVVAHALGQEHVCDHKPNPLAPPCVSAGLTWGVPGLS